MISQLVQKIQKTKAPICVGLDPMLGYIPSHIVQKSFNEFGETLEGAADAIWQFNKEIIDNTYDLIPSVKPQIAMYEQFGIEGLKIYARTVEYCQQKANINSAAPFPKISVLGSVPYAYIRKRCSRIDICRLPCRKTKACCAFSSLVYRI